MPTPQKSDVFKKTYKQYLSEITEKNLSSRQKILGITAEDEEIRIPFFGKSYRVSSAGIMNPSGKTPRFDICVILCKYLLLCPDAVPKGEDWISYRDSRDAGPLTKYFSDNVENAIARRFSGKPGALAEKCEQRGGKPPDIELSYDLAMQFDMLPRVPLLLLFNDADEDFPAQCSVLFRKNGDKYLDPECLAMLGAFLATNLK